MKLLRLIVVSAGIALICQGSLLGQQRGEVTIGNSDRHSNPSIIWSADQTFTAENGVVVRYELEDITLTADRATGNLISGDVLAEGTVTIQSGTNYWTGPRLQFNHLTESITGRDFKTGQGDVFAGGALLEKDGSSPEFHAGEAYLTTDDAAAPGFRIQASEITIVPGEYIKAKNATLRLGDVPVFYFPYFKKRLDGRSNHFSILPGYRSEFGPFLLTEYDWFLNDSLSGTLHLDWRHKRGFAGGADFEYDLGEFGEGKIGTYYADDDRPGTDRRTNEPIGNDRYLLEFSHRVELRTNLVARVIASGQSDAQITRDFFESKYRSNPQPKSFLEVSQLWQNYSLNLVAQPQVNDFFEDVERLPDLKFSAFRQQLGPLPLYYEGESSGAYLRRRFYQPGMLDYEAFRGDSFHQVLYPNTFFGWLNFTPRVGGRFTYYSEAEGPGATTDSESRSVFNTGAELSFKASRLWRSASNDLLDVSGLRHIVRPSLNYIYIPNPSAPPRDLPQFDYETQLYDMPAILFPDFNSIDAIDSQNALRLGLWNTLQTKRDGELDNLLIWGIYSDWRISEKRDQSTFSDIYSEMEIKPRSWLSLYSKLRFDTDDTEFRISDNRITLTPNPTWSLGLGHRFVDHPGLFATGEKTSLITSTLYYRISDNWGSRISLHYEAEDGQMQEQYYTIYRDLRSWTAALTFRIRDDEDSPRSYGLALAVSLKSWPSFNLGDDTNRPTLLLGD